MPSRQQLKQLELALINAFPSKSLLERLLYYELEKNLNQITKDSDLQEIVFKLIQTAESQGWLIDLVYAARKENPGNSELEAIALELLLSPEIPSISKSFLSSSATVTKSSTQQRKTLVLPAYVVVFVLIAGGTTLSVFNLVTEKQLIRPPSPPNSTSPSNLHNLLLCNQPRTSVLKRV